MKTFKHLLVLTAILSSTILYAQGDRNILRRKDGTEVPCEKIEKFEDGMITYKEGAVSRRIKLSDLSYAFAAKKGCSMILDADKLFASKDYAGALTAYETAEARYGRIGWDIYTKRKQGECLAAQNQDGLLISKLKDLIALKPLDKDNAWKQADLDVGMSLLVTAMAKTKDPKTKEVIAQILEGVYPEAIGAAHNASGAMAYYAGDLKGAFYDYAKTSLLYAKSPARPEALCRAANIMKELKDARGGKFADILKNEHPSSPWIKELK